MGPYTGFTKMQAIFASETDAGFASACAARTARSGISMRIMLACDIKAHSDTQSGLIVGERD